MRKAFWTLLSAVIVALSLVSCSKEIEELNSKIDSLDQRLTALEQKVNQDISALQTAVKALEAKLTVVSVDNAEDGYVIKFSDGTTATISNGKKGDKGDTPSIGIALQNIGGVATYVWTINGEVAKDANGNPYPVVGVQGENGITPHFKYDENHWYVSYDYVDENNQGTWVRVDTDNNAPSVTVDAESDPDYIILNIGGTEVKLPKEKAFALTISYDGDITAVGISLGQDLALPYTVTGVDATDVITVDVLSTSAGLSAKVVATDAVSGYIVISAATATSGKVLVFADNNKGKASIKVITLEEGVLSSVADVDAQLTGDGGEVGLQVTTNVEYEVVIPTSAQSWITLSPDTRAAHTDKLLLTVAPNTTGGYRAATVSLKATATGETVQTYEIVQQPAFDGTPTSLSSLASLADGTDVIVDNVTVLAANSGQAVITDGEHCIYVLASGLTPGSVVKLTGVKESDNGEATYVNVSSVEVNTEGVPAEYTAHDGFIYADWAGSAYFTVAVNELMKDGDLYYVIAGDETVLLIDEAPAGISLDALVGKEVVLKGWTTAVDLDYENELYLITTIPTYVDELVLSQQAGWTISYDGMTSDDEDYPELISFDAQFSEGEYVTLAVLSEEELGGEIDTVIPTLLPEMMSSLHYSLTFYNFLYGYTFDELFGIFAYNDSFSESYEEFEPGNYYIIAMGLDEDGAINGQYAYQLFEKKDNHIKAAYEDFLGDWTFTNSEGIYEYWTLTEKVAGESYYVSGFSNMTINDLGGGELAEAVYDPDKGNVSVSNQYVGDLWDYSSYVLQDKFVAVWWGSSGFYSNEPYMDDPTIFIMSFVEGGDAEIKVLSDDYGQLEGFAYMAEDTGGAGNLSYGNATSLGGAALYKGIVEPELPPEDPELPIVFSEDFEEEGVDAAWTLIDADGDGYVWAQSISESLSCHSGIGIFQSASYINDIGALTPDNWAFTPAISFTSGNYLSFWVTAQDLSYVAEHYAVYIIGEAPSADNLSSATKLFESTYPDNAPVQEVSVGGRVYQRFVLEIPSAFANKTGYIGFRHFNCTDMFYLNLDDVCVTEGYPVASSSAPKKPVVKKQQKSEKRFQLVTEKVSRRDAKSALKAQSVNTKKTGCISKGIVALGDRRR